MRTACPEENIKVENDRSEKTVKCLWPPKRIIFQDLGKDPGLLFFRVPLLLTKYLGCHWQCTYCIPYISGTKIAVDYYLVSGEKLLEFRFQFCSTKCENWKHFIWLTFLPDWETKKWLSFFYPRPCIIPLDCLLNRQISQNEALFQKLAFTSGFPNFWMFGLVAPMFCLNLILESSSKH